MHGEEQVQHAGGHRHAGANCSCTWAVASANWELLHVLPHVARS